MTKQEEIVLIELDWSDYKICNKCGKVKRKIDFYNNRNNCKECTIKYVQDWRKNKNK